MKGLRFSCPSCGTKFRALPKMHVAITFHDRTCRNPECRERWRLRVEPLSVPIKDMHVHVAELTFLGHTPTGNAARWAGKP